MGPEQEGARASRRTPGSLRTRLTLWIVAVFAVVQLTLCFVFLLYQRSSVMQWFDERIDARAAAVTPILRELAPGFMSEKVQELASEQNRMSVLGGAYIAVYGRDGAQLASSAAMNVDAAEDVRKAVETGARVYGHTPGGGMWGPEATVGAARYTVRPFEGVDGQRYAMLYAASTASLARMLELVRQVIFVSVPLGLVAVGVAGWFIAGFIVAPIQQLEEVARALSPESIGQQLLTPTASRETSSLAVELENARSRLEAGFRSQERFISNVSHELKTPLAVILTESQTLDKGGLSAPAAAFVRSCEDELRRLARMIDSFLMLTRVREGRRISRIQQVVQVNDLVMDSVQHCAGMARQQGVRLLPTLLEADEDIDLRVAGDADLLRTMLDNLVRNALRFSAEGQAVEITAHREGSDALIRVRDYGVGIPPEIIERIFDRFAQATSEERRGRGHGLGLEIAQGIAELHAGIISVRNHPEKGCEFTVRLPVSS